METEKLELYKKRDLGEILTDAVDFFRDNFKGLIRMVAMVALPIFLIGRVMMTMKLMETLEFITGRGNFSDLLSRGLLGSEMLLGGICIFVGYTVLNLVALYYLELYREGKEIDIPAVLSLIFSRGWKLLYMYLVTGAVIFAVLLFFGMLISLVFAGLVAAIGIANPILTGFLLILLYTPLIYITIPFLLATQIFIIERIGIAASYSRAFELLKGRWFRSFGVFTLSVLVILVLTYGLEQLLSYLLGLGEVNDLRYSPMRTVQIYALINSLVSFLSFFIYIIIYLAVGILTYSLIEEKDFVSLNQRIDSMDIPAPENQNPQSPGQ